MLIALAAYVLLYGCARHSRWFVHRVGFQTLDGEWVVAQHRVATRDSGAMGQGFYLDVAALLCTPLRWVETSLWYIAQPPGTEAPSGAATNDMAHR